MSHPVYNESIVGKVNLANSITRTQLANATHTQNTQARFHLQKESIR